MNRTLDIFYNQIIKEATTGRINCFLYFNMPFSTYIYETNEKYECHFPKSDELLVPTLIIKNKKVFDDLLVEYTNLALNFYNDSNFPEEVLDDKMYYENKICKEKIILTTLWSNATVEDFGNPIGFLEKRISFLKNNLNSKEIEHVDTFDGKLFINITKDNILNETPFQMEIFLKNDIGDTYHFPKIKLGIHNDKAYIYAIQNKEQESNLYAKKINRILYKVNENLFDNYEEDNLKDITPSFLVAINICTSYLNSIGIEEILVPNVLIERWNAKNMAIMIKSKQKHLTLDEIKGELEKQNMIWVNINEKLVRTFRRLEYHHQSINITSEPFLVDTHLHLKIDDFINCNNPLLFETYNVVNKTTKTNTK